MKILGWWPRYRIRAPRSAFFWPNVGTRPEPHPTERSRITDVPNLDLYSFPMPPGLYRIHHSGHSHFVTFSCYRRQPFFNDTQLYDLFCISLERMRQRFRVRVYGYVVMPEHVHLLLSEPEKSTLADAIHFLKIVVHEEIAIPG